MSVKRLWRQTEQYGDDRLGTPQERRLAGRVIGAVWVCGAATLLIMLPVPGERIAHVWPVALIGALAAIGGLLLLRPVHWAHAPRVRFHLATALVAAAVFVIQALTGGEASPADEYLWVVVVCAAFFSPARPALAYGLGCSLVAGSPLLYDRGAVEANLARELLMVVPLFFVVGAIIFAGRELLAGLSYQARALEHEQRRMAAEQSSLRRVATAVAAGAPPEVIFALVSSEVGASWAPMPPPSGATSASGG